MRVVAAFPREPSTPSVKLRPRRFHAIEILAGGALAQATLCALLTSGLDFGSEGLHSWAEVRRGRCPVCSAIVEHRAIQGDPLEHLDGAAAQGVPAGAVSILS